MKKSLVAVVLGVAVSSTAFGQGHVNISNYLVSPYNQVIWANTVAEVGAVANQAVHNSAVQLTLWYGLGAGLDASALTTQGATFNVLLTGNSADYDPGLGNGAGGYYFFSQDILGWASGSTYTFQIRASGSQGQWLFEGASPLFQLSDKIVSSANPALNADAAPGISVNVIPVPEPSIFALAGIGSAALLVFRRKN